MLFFLSISLWSDGEERGLDNLEAENDFVKAEENASDFSLIMTLKYLPAWLSIALFLSIQELNFL